jgi:hypothetical protein
MYDNQIRLLVDLPEHGMLRGHIFTVIRRDRVAHGWVVQDDNGEELWVRFRDAIYADEGVGNEF